MGNRRQFLKSTLVVAAGLTVGANTASADTGPFPSGVVYTKGDPGKWAKKVGSHVPQVMVDGNKVALKTKHGMSDDHYIVRHTLVSADGEVVGSKVFRPDSKPKSEYTVPGKGTYYATSFCNLHDFWVTTFTV